MPGRKPDDHRRSALLHDQSEHIPALPLWTQVTQILYNVAVAVLAIRSI